ncbi:MAG: hypothetical protein SGCHY_004602, partial [Lobulomycetales sp.]
MDLDVEALLDAPLEKKRPPTGDKRKSEGRGGRSRSPQRKRHSRDRSRERSRDKGRRSRDGSIRSSAETREHRRSDHHHYRRSSRDVFDARSESLKGADHQRSRKSSGDQKAEGETALVRVASPRGIEDAGHNIQEIERNARTVLVTQLSAKVDKDILGKFFSAAGEIREARIVLDKVSGRSKG